MSKQLMQFIYIESSVPCENRLYEKYIIHAGSQQYIIKSLCAALINSTKKKILRDQNKEASGEKRK